MMHLPDSPDWNAHTRAAMVTFWLLNGSQLTTAEIARLTNQTWTGAYYLMINLSASLPITQVDGKWQRILSDLTPG